MGFFDQAKIYPLKTLKTSLAYLAFIGLGLSISVFGPCLLDLQVLTNTTLDEIALIFPARSGGYAVGSVIVGFVGEFLDHQIILIISLMITCISTFSVSFISSIKLMYIVTFIGGVSSGGIDTTSNVWTIHMWGKENPPFMQLLHFFFGLGALIAPFIAEPFLLKKKDPLENNLNKLNFTFENLTSQADDDYKDLKILYPFTFISIFNLLVLLALIVVYFKNPSNEPHPTRKEGNSENEDSKDKTSLKPLSFKMKLFVIILSTLFMHFFVGLEISFGSLLATFAVKSNLKLSKSEGSYLSGIYWIAYTFFRLITFFVITLFSSKQLLIMCFVVVMISNGILLPFSNNYNWALWAGSIIMGFGCSPIFATWFGFLGQITTVTSRMTSIFMVSACLGEFIIPYVVGLFIETNPEVYLYIVFIYSFMAVMVFSILAYLYSFLLKKQNQKSNIEITCLKKY